MDYNTKIAKLSYPPNSNDVLTKKLTHLSE